MIHPANISISEFSYRLPEKKIAVYPLESRDASKLLVYRDGRITDARFSIIDEFVDPDSVLVFNNTRVIRARLQFSDNGKPVEIFCLEPASSDFREGGEQKGTATWNCLVGKLKSWKNERISVTANGITLEATIFEKHPSHVTVKFRWTPPELPFKEVLASTGSMPIPPYLNRESEELDVTRYQTVYAEEDGSVAAPTAGLHFTPEILQKIEGKGIKVLHVTLHVGAGTFKPVKTDTMQDHEMHAEWISVSTDTIRTFSQMSGRKIIAVGTTSLRTIESLYWMGSKVFRDPDLPLHALTVGQWEPYVPDQETVTPSQALQALLKWLESRRMSRLVCQTAILIAPPYQLRLAAGLVTNFHQPQSTLLLLVSAVVGEKWKEIYEHALKCDYRFLSYGDSSLLYK